MAEVQFTPAAVNDIDHVWEWIARDNISAANNFVSKMYDVFEQLAIMPLSARKRPELGENMRSRPYGNYIIFYEPLPDGIMVLNVLWGGRDIDAFFEDEY